MFEIEKAIPIPAKRPGIIAKYPFLKMEIGDSFLVNDGTRIKGQLAGSANKRFKPKRFTSRKLTDGSIRIWRIE